MINVAVFSLSTVIVSNLLFNNEKLTEDKEYRKWKPDEQEVARFGFYGIKWLAMVPLARSIDLLRSKSFSIIPTSPYSLIFYALFCSVPILMFSKCKKNILKYFTLIRQVESVAILILLRASVTAHPILFGAAVGSLAWNIWTIWKSGETQSGSISEDTINNASAGSFTGENLGI